MPKFSEYTDVSSPAAGDQFLIRRAGLTPGGLGQVTFAEIEAGLSLNSLSGTLSTAKGGSGADLSGAADGRVPFMASAALATSAGLTYAVGTGRLSVTALTVSGFTATRVPYAGVGGALTDSATLTYDATTAGLVTTKPVAASQLTSAGLTSGRVPYASTAGLLVDSSGLTFDGTTVTVAAVNHASSLLLKIAAAAVLTLAAASVTVAQPILAANGSQANPSYSFSSATGLGLYERSGVAVTFTVAGGKDALDVQGGTITMPSTSLLGWANTANASTAQDTILVRDGAAGTIGQRNGANAQAFNLYNTYTDASNYERLAFHFSSGTTIISNEAAGSGSVRTLKIFGSSFLELGSNGGTTWRIDNSGNFLALADNSYDFGASGATRPRSGYFGTSVVVGSGSGASIGWTIGNTASGIARLISTSNASGSIDYIASVDSVGFRLNSSVHKFFFSGTDGLHMLQSHGISWNGADPGNTTGNLFLKWYAAGLLSVTGDGTGASGTNAGFILGNVTSNQSGIYYSGLTPGAGNYGLAMGSTYATLNSPTAGGTAVIAVAGTAVLTAAAASLTAVQPHRAADGAAGTPQFSFTNASTSGLYKAGTNTVGMATGGGVNTFWESGAMTLDRQMALQWTDASGVGGGRDLILVRDAADTLAQRRTTTAQAFRLYNTYTDASNYERLEFSFSSNHALIATGNAGTGSTRELRLDGSGAVRVMQAGVTHFVTSSGSSTFNIRDLNLVWNTDNTNDIGASGANRPRTGYFGTNVVAGGSYTSGAPNGGTAAPWKMGSYKTAVVTADLAHYVELDISGTLYKLGVVT